MYRQFKLHILVESSKALMPIKREIVEVFQCPITTMVMQDPVKAADGFFYKRLACVVLGAGFGQENMQIRPRQRMCWKVLQ